MTRVKIKDAARRLAKDIGDVGLANIIEEAFGEIAEEETELDWRSFGEPEEPERWDGMN